MWCLSSLLYIQAAGKKGKEWEKMSENKGIILTQMNNDLQLRISKHDANVSWLIKPHETGGHMPIL